MVTVCRSFSFALLIFKLSGVQDEYLQVHVRVKIVHWMCVCMCARICQHIMSKCLSVQYVCVIGAGSMGDERGKTWEHGLVFPEYRWIMTAAGFLLLLVCWLDHTSTPHYIYGNSKTWCLYLHTVHRAAGKTFQCGKAECLYWVTLLNHPIVLYCPFF